MDWRVLEFPVMWAVLVGAAYAAVVGCQRASRGSAAAGVAARIVASMALALLGYGAALHHLLMVGAMCCGSCYALERSLGWLVWVAAAGAAAVPWVAWLLVLLLGKS